jgi:hypothetical protein
MKNKVTTLLPALLLAAGLHAQNTPSPIDTATTARYKYQQNTYSYTILDPGVSFDALSVTEKEELKPVYEEAEYTSGINNNYEPYFQVKYIKAAKPEAWMTPPAVHIITPTKSLGLTASNEVLFEFMHQPEMLEDIEAQTTMAEEYGFMPVLMLFPNMHSDFVTQAQANGAVLTILSETKFKLAYTDSDVTFDTENRTITTNRTTAEEEESSYEEYTLYAPYGFVLKFTETRTHKSTGSNALTRVTRAEYSNHVIINGNNLIPKYTDATEISVHPNPVGEEYQVYLRGMPEAQVAMVQIRDYMGTLVATHLSPPVHGDLVELSAATYPNGTFIIQVYTQQGIYTDLIIK